jgi:hypothetical protein
MAFVVTGVWGTSRGDKIVHQETVHDDSRREKYDAIKCIRYTDGTVLYVNTYPLLEPPQKLGYKDLLDRAVAKGLTGTFSVMDI